MLALLAVSIEANQRQARQVSTVTRTSTTVTTKFSTVTSTTRTVCVNYVNATSACRRKRQFWIDTPIVLALDEELDPFAQQFLQPSPVLSVQPTVQPYFRNGGLYPGQSQVQSSHIERPSLPDIQNPYLFRDGLSPFRPVRPYRPAYNFNPYGASPYGASPYGVIPEGRLGAVGLLNLFAQILGVAPTTTATVTSTVSATTTSFATSTGTLVISGCSPPGITYASCAASG